jgi:hypothetical protein
MDKSKFPSDTWGITKTEVGQSEDWVAIAAFGRAKEKWFREFLELQGSSRQLCQPT